MAQDVVAEKTVLLIFLETTSLQNCCFLLFVTYNYSLYSTYVKISLYSTAQCAASVSASQPLLVRQSDEIIE